MEALAVLRLSASPRRRNGSMEMDDESALHTPYTSAPSSPRRAFAKEEENEPLGEVRAAVPFVWELVPGTPKNDVEGEGGEETEREQGSPGGSETTGSSSALSRNSSNTEFEFSNRFAGVVEPLPCRAAEELFANGQLLPLRLPPRLQAMKNLRTSDSTLGSSFHSAGSPRVAGPPKKLVAAMQERPRSVTPLRLFNRESGAPGGNLSSDSVSSASSFSSETNGDSAQDSHGEEDAKGKDILFSDMGGENSKTMISRSRPVQSKRELLKQQQKLWNGFVNAEKVAAAAAAAPAPALIAPPLSRSNARSRCVESSPVQSSFLIFNSLAQVVCVIFFPSSNWLLMFAHYIKVLESIVARILNHSFNFSLSRLHIVLRSGKNAVLLISYKI